MGIDWDCHESDLYFEKTPESEQLVNEYKFKNNVEIFKDDVTGKPFYDVPFACG